MSNPIRTYNIYCLMITNGLNKKWNKNAINPHNCCNANGQCPTFSTFILFTLNRNAFSQLLLLLRIFAQVLRIDFWILLLFAIDIVLFLFLKHTLYTKNIIMSVLSIILYSFIVFFIYHIWILFLKAYCQFGKNVIFVKFCNFC